MSGLQPWEGVILLQNSDVCEFFFGASELQVEMVGGCNILCIEVASDRVCEFFVERLGCKFS